MSPQTAFYIATWLAIIVLFLGLGAILREVRLLRATISRDMKGFTASQPDINLGIRFANQLVLAADSGCGLCVSVAEKLSSGVLLTHESESTWNTTLPVISDPQTWRAISHLSPPILMQTDSQGQVTKLLLIVREEQVAQTLAQWGVLDAAHA